MVGTRRAEVPVPDWDSPWSVVVTIAADLSAANSAAACGVSVGAVARRARLDGGGVGTGRAGTPGAEPPANGWNPGATSGKTEDA